MGKKALIVWGGWNDHEPEPRWRRTQARDK